MSEETAMQETQVQSLGWEDPVEEGMAILEATPPFLPRESHGQGVWWATVHRAAKSRTRLK